MQNQNDYMRCKDCEFCIPLEDAPNVVTVSKETVAVCKMAFQHKSPYEIFQKTIDEGSTLLSCGFGPMPFFTKLHFDDKDLGYFEEVKK
jgi:hypothetical protein